MQKLLRIANSKTRIFLQVKRKNRPDGNVGIEKEDMYREKRTRGNPWMTIVSFVPDCTGLLIHFHTT
jgi:hypothetical protein